MIRLKDVFYSYDGRRAVLHGVSVEFGQGVTAVLGPNGSGKTTLLKVASLLYRPYNGIVFLNGRDFWALGKNERIKLRRNVVYVHEKPVLIRGRVLDNVAYGLIIRGYPRGDALARAEETLAGIGAEKLAWKNSRDLSAGEKQLISLARAFAVKPRFLFLDEPFSNLDIEKRRTVSSFLLKLASRGAAVTIATHDSLVASRLASKIIYLESGRVVKVGRPEHVLEV